MEAKLRLQESLLIVLPEQVLKFGLFELKRLLIVVCFSLFGYIIQNLFFIQSISAQESKQNNWPSYLSGEEKSRPGADAVSSQGQYVSGAFFSKQGQNTNKPNKVEVILPSNMSPRRSNILPFNVVGSPFSTYNPSRINSNSKLGSSVITVQTGPSPSSGNYYQGSTSETGSSGSYYASSPAWQIPVMNGSSTDTQNKDYWGPDGNPFLNSSKYSNSKNSKDNTTKP